jgi:citrate synthase
MDGVDRGDQIDRVEQLLDLDLARVAVGLIYKAMGFPTKMFTVLFALGRLPGWIAQWREMINGPDITVGRPRRVHTGQGERTSVPMEER